MHDLKERLESLASEGALRGADLVLAGARRALDGMPVTHALVPQRRMPRPALVGIAIVVVLAVVASSLLLLRDPAASPSPSNLVPVLPNENPYRDLFQSTPARPGDPTTFLVPGFLPAGMQPLEITGGFEPDRVTSRGGSPSTKHQQTWVRFDTTSERPAEVIIVSWGPGTTDPLAGTRNQGTRVDLRDTTGYLRPHQGSLTWEEPAGQLVSVTAETLDRAEIVAMADAFERHGEDFTVAEAPAGFVQVTDDPGMASDGTNARTMIYKDAQGRGLEIRVADAVERSPGASLSDVGPGAIGADPHVVDVRGHHAVVARIALNGGGAYNARTTFMVGANQTVQWREPRNVTVTVNGVGLTEAEVLAVARGLRRVDADGWDEVLALAPGRSGAPPPAPAQLAEPVRGERAAVADAFERWLSSTRDLDTMTEVIEDGTDLRGSFEQLAKSSNNPAHPGVRVTSVRLVGTDRALVTFTILSDGRELLPDQQGGAVKIDGRWRVSRSTFCSVVALVNVQCAAP